ncbi:MAG: hypothetical protein L3K18_03925 [Thermoplasmata archaeon]|nr:hypothetical protein [Thermoplasmata archaeon]
MADGVSPSVSIPLPRPVDRRLHLGPFPSARDALKFAGYACAGLVAVPLAGPAAVVPFAGLGFLLAVYRRDGRALDDRVAGYLAWRWRRRLRHRPSGDAGSTSAGATALVGGGRVAAVVRAGGVPVAFLPPDDARSLFEGTRRWLDALDGGVYLVADATPFRAAPFRPKAAAGPADRAARDGYDEVVRLLLRRRRARRVAVVLWEPADPAGVARLEGRVQATSEALRGLGLATERLRGAELRSDLARLALSGGNGR